MKMPSFKLGDLTVKVPVIQGGMGVGVSMSKLAAAVANQGGVGIISGAQPGYKEPDFRTDNKAANIRGMVKEIREAKRLSPDGVIGINFLAVTNHYKEYVIEAVKEKVDLIIMGAGLPKTLPALVKGSSTKIAPIVSSGRAIETILKLWDKRYSVVPDVVIVEGPLAGGHLGFSREQLFGEMPNLNDIVVDVVNAVKSYEEKYDKKIPVIAAGGIFSGDEIKEMLSLGASGVQMGTRFVATEECDASLEFKMAFVNAKEEDIQIIQSPVGLPGRAIRNDFVKKIEVERIPITKCYRCISTCDPKTTPFCITEALIDSVNGDVDNGLVFVGHNAYKLDKISTVKEVFEELQREYDEA
jgi:NAD(P)H-dependent flavin oxidoreductase YrpB (nitropropane dioxygenase family)